MDEFDGVVDEVFTEVVALRRALGGFDPVIVVDEVGRELVRLTVEKPVVPIEAALQGPLVERPSLTGRKGRRVVVFAKPRRGIAVIE